MGDRITLKDIAREVGVRPETVSKVLNGKGHVSGETEQRIWRVAREMAYRPNIIARSLRSQQSHTLGLSWRPAPPDQLNPILDRFLQVVVETARQAGYYILPYPITSDTRHIKVYQELVDTNRVDGFILSSTNFDDQRIQYFQKINFPFVAFGRANPDWKFSAVDVDGTAGIRLATEHLTELGHTKIAILAWPETSISGTNRLEGYLQAMQHRDLAVNDRWIIRSSHSVQAAREATAQLLELPAALRPTAIVALSDLMAIGAMKEVTQRGLSVGHDIAVTGFDDVPMAQFLSPSLTTVRQPIQQVGQLSVERLLRLIHKEFVAEDLVLLEPELVVRGSSTGIE
ncbi:MAG: LacI family DNA-binding transcriptional regulator [Chloroflexi bacterium]|nr:LacI family DNA-binding transcriptional regulator [Chloroflexota bacterium]